MQCTFQTYRAKELNTHRRTFHQIAALQCCVEMCPFKTILAEKMIDHLEKKHFLRPEDAQATAQNIIACQQPAGPPRMAAPAPPQPPTITRVTQVDGYKDPELLEAAAGASRGQYQPEKKRAKYYFLPTTKPGKRKLKNPKSEDCKLFKPGENQNMNYQGAENSACSPWAPVHGALLVWTLDSLCYCFCLSQLQDACLF